MIIQTVNLLLLTNLFVNSITASNTSLMKTNKTDKLMTGFLRRTNASALTSQGHAATSPLLNVEEDGLLHDHDVTDTTSINSRQLSASAGVYVNGMVCLFRGKGNLNNEIASQTLVQTLAPQWGSTEITFPTDTLRTGYPSRQVFYFNGTGKAVGSAAGLPEGSAPRTIVGWFKRNGPTSNVSKGPFGYGEQSCGRLYHVSIPSASNILELDQWCRDEGINPIISNLQNIWYHVAISWDGEKNTAFVNGVQVAQGTPDQATNTNVNGLQALVVIGGTDSVFVGYVADFAVFNRPLTVGEVSSIYQNPTGLVVCTSGSHCASGYCSNNICTSGQNGASCDSGENDDCISDYCDPGTNTCISQPSNLPSQQPSKIPSQQPSKSLQPSNLPSQQPSNLPSQQPSNLPSQHPSEKPSVIPSHPPSFNPSFLPSKQPTLNPSIFPSTQFPSTQLYITPTGLSMQPSNVPTMTMTQNPSKTSDISMTPSFRPSKLVRPSNTPSKSPSTENDESSTPSDTPTKSKSESSTKPSMIKLKEENTTLFIAFSASTAELAGLSKDTLNNIANAIGQYLKQVINVESVLVELDRYGSSSLLEDGNGLQNEVMMGAAKFVANVQTITSVLNSTDMSMKINDILKSDPEALTNTIMMSAGGSLNSLSGSIASLEDIYPSTYPSTVPRLLSSSMPSLIPNEIPSNSPSVLSSLSPSLEPSVYPTVAPSQVFTRYPSIEPSDYVLSVEPSSKRHDNDSFLQFDGITSKYPTSSPNVDQTVSPTGGSTTNNLSNDSLEPTMMLSQEMSFAKIHPAAAAGIAASSAAAASSSSSSSSAASSASATSSTGTGNNVMATRKGSTSKNPVSVKTNDRFSASSQEHDHKNFNKNDQMAHKNAPGNTMNSQVTKTSVTARDRRNRDRCKNSDDGEEEADSIAEDDLEMNRGSQGGDLDTKPTSFCVTELDKVQYNTVQQNSENTNCSSLQSEYEENSPNRSSTNTKRSLIMKNEGIDYPDTSYKKHTTRDINVRVEGGTATLSNIYNRDRVKCEHNGIEKSNVAESAGIVECEQSEKNSSSQGTTNGASSVDQLAEYYRSESPSLSLDPTHDTVLSAKCKKEDIQYNSNSIEHSTLSEHTCKNDSASKVLTIRFEDAGVQSHVNNDIESSGINSISEEVDEYANDGIQHQLNSIERSISNEHGCKNDRASTVPSIQVEERGIDSFAKNNVEASGVDNVYSKEEDFICSKKDQIVEEKYARVEGGTATLSNNRLVSKKKKKKKGQIQIESEQVVYFKETIEFAHERTEDEYSGVEGGTATLSNIRTTDKVKVDLQQADNDDDVENVPEMKLVDKLRIAEGALEDGFDTSFSEKYDDKKRTIKKFMKHSTSEKSGNNNNLETIYENEKDGRLKFMRRKNDDDEVLGVYFYVAIGIRKLLMSDVKVETHEKEGVFVGGDAKKDGSLKKTSKMRRYLKTFFGRKQIGWDDNIASGAAEELADEENQLDSNISREESSSSSSGLLALQGVLDDVESSVTLIRRRT